MANRIVNNWNDKKKRGLTKLNIRRIKKLKKFAPTTGEHSFSRAFLCFLSKFVFNLPSFSVVYCAAKTAEVDTAAAVMDYQQSLSVLIHSFQQELAVEWRNSISYPIRRQLCQKKDLF